MNETSTAPAPTTALPEKTTTTRRLIVREVIETVVLVVIVFVVARFAIGNYSILGQSMEPNYHQDQRLLVDKVTPHVFGYSRGDIVIVHSPTDGIELIKRLIGKPGDTIELRDNSVIVNGQPLSEPYLPPNANSGPTSGNTKWTLDADQYFVMGDNRSYSKDSRAIGPVSSSNIIGRALLLYWPLNNAHLVQHYSYQ